MYGRLSLSVYLEQNAQNSRFLRAFAARLNTSLGRVSLSPSKVASSMRVPLSDVRLWLAGNLVPTVQECRRLAELIGLDVERLCGITPDGGSSLALESPATPAR